MTDVVLIAPANATITYQSLAVHYSAIEPPTWALILAESCRKAGFEPKILDCLAENLSDQAAIDRIRSSNPRFICFVVYGQNVNAGTTNMSGAVRLAEAIKADGVLKPQLELLVHTFKLCRGRLWKLRKLSM
mgnify:CR=1 FL=1